MSGCQQVEVVHICLQQLLLLLSQNRQLLSQQFFRLPQIAHNSVKNNPFLIILILLSLVS